MDRLTPWLTGRLCVPVWEPVSPPHPALPLGPPCLPLGTLCLDPCQAVAVMK